MDNININHYDDLWCVNERLITNWIRLLLDNINMKCKCKKIIPIQRVNLGYTTCVNCSTTERYGCAPLINHKTGNSIQKWVAKTLLRSLRWLNVEVMEQC